MTSPTLNLLGNKYLYMTDYNQVISPALKKIFLENAALREIPVQDVEVNKEILEERVRKLPQLIFEVSANCNLRCSYCVYNGNYINQRQLTPRNMTFETARKGIDYIYSQVKDRTFKEFSIGFYGGEPLLNPGVIQEIIDYSRSCFQGWELHFNMTSNLTLLNENILDMLLKNNISVLVSLDGGKDNHDAKRRGADGRGTFDSVMKNLEKIKTRDPDYFQRKIGFSAVYSMDLPLENVYRFFTSNEELGKSRMRFNTVNTYNTTYYDTYPYEKERFQKNFKQMFSQLLDNVREGRELSGMETYLYTAFMETGSFLKVRRYSVLGGSCMFDDRLYLDSSGHFHICEKMNHTFPIGDVDSGFDFERMESIVNEFSSVVKKNCLDCSIRFLCKRCYVTFGGDGVFGIDPEFCKNQKESIISNLERYIQWMEERDAQPQTAGISPQQYRFHQFITISRGPVNTAVIDLLKGNVFQVENRMVDQFVSGKYDEIKEFMDFAMEEALIVDAGGGHWHPPSELDWPAEDADYMDVKTQLELHVEEGADLDLVLEKLNDSVVYMIYYYGDSVPGSVKFPAEVIKQPKDFNRCLEESCIDGNFPPLSHLSYMINRKYNSCWGSKIAVTADGSVRPCLYSRITVGNINTDDMPSMLEKLKSLWAITHGKIEKCKDCELKYVCHDCRELAFRKTGNLTAPPVNCFYDPYTGTWQD